MKDKSDGVMLKDHLWQITYESDQPVSLQSFDVWYVPFQPSWLHGPACARCDNQDDKRWPSHAVIHADPHTQGPTTCLDD